MKTTIEISTSNKNEISRMKISLGAKSHDQVVGAILKMIRDLKLKEDLKITFKARTSKIARPLKEVGGSR